MKKGVLQSYNLNRDNYIYLNIMNIGNFSSKIILNHMNNDTIFNSFIEQEKEVSHKKYTLVNELEVMFTNKYNELYDFNGRELSFSIEITEMKNKLKYVDIRD